MLTAKEDCYTASKKYCACIEFRVDEDQRHGFHISQLIEYTLEPNPDAEDNKDAPPQKLALALFTADVVILGWRLGRLADLLRENELATVHVMPKRYADIEQARPCVASITITRIGRDSS